MKIKNDPNARKVIIAFSAILILGSTIYLTETDSERKEITVLTEDNSFNISVEIADSESEREKGLMYRRKLELDEGMLFVFEDEEPRSFWMKNTYIPLDIVFIDSDGRVINIEEAYPEPNTSENDLKTYESAGDAQFVLELNSTFSEKYSLNTNDRVKFYNTVR